MKYEFIWTDSIVQQFAERYARNVSRVGHLPYFVKNRWMSDFKEEIEAGRKQKITKATLFHKINQKQNGT